MLYSALVRMRKRGIYGSVFVYAVSATQGSMKYKYIRVSIVMFLLIRICGFAIKLRSRVMPSFAYLECHCNINLCYST